MHNEQNITDAMDRSDAGYGMYLAILKEELLTAMGCTEPIALAYAAALAHRTLGALPERVEVAASGNIIKNIKSVVVPNTDGLRGIEAAVAAGVVAGDPDRQLEVIARVTDDARRQIHEYLAHATISATLAETPLLFDIIVTAYKGRSYAKVRIAQYHTNVVRIEKDGVVLAEKAIASQGESDLTDRSALSVGGILDFAQSVAIDDVKPLLDKQISYNMAIAEEGLKGDYGANIGSVLLSTNADNVRTRARAMAAAGSDARMNGCELPVVINSGSGNQGITVSVPVIVYARELGVSDETLYRALTLSNLIAIHQKSSIGRLSAYCGAVNAGSAAGCGICYLNGGGYEEITHTLVNALAIVSGIVCDGAKASCAGKIAVAVDAGILGYEMYCCHQQFYGGDGIVKKGVEKTIASVGRLGREGMRETDKEIISIMIHDD